MTLILACTSALAVPMPFATPPRPGPSAAQLETQLVAARAAQALTADQGYVLVTPRDAGKGAKLVADPGRVRYTYDKLGRRTSMTAAALAGTVSHGYDAVGRLTSLTDHRGRHYGFAYDVANRLLEDADTDYDYDANGSLSSRGQALALVTDHAPWGHQVVVSERRSVRKRRRTRLAGTPSLQTKAPTAVVQG